MAKTAKRRKSTKNAHSKKGVSKEMKQLEAKKEQYIQSIMGLFQVAGYEVRREKLKRGAGWSVQGGACAVFGEPVLFVDRNLNRDDQVDFLIGQFQKSALHTVSAVSEAISKMESEELETLPGPIKALFDESSALVA